MESGIDYKDMENGLNAIANKFSTKRPERSQFKNKNFMTQEIVCERTLPNGYTFELSYGSGIFSAYIIGVSIAHKGKMLNNPPLKCCHEFEEVEEVLTKVSNY